jgi:hypothetical protein
MLPGAPISKIDPNAALSASAREILLGRYPQLSEDLLKQEIASIAKMASAIQYKIYTQVPGVKDGDRMRSKDHNDLLDAIAVDLNMLYSRISIVQQLLTKLQTLSAYGAKDIRTQLKMLEAKTKQLIAVNNSNSLFGALILTTPITANYSTNLEAVGDNALTINFDETLYNEYYYVQSVAITRPDDIYGYNQYGLDIEGDYSGGTYSGLKKGMAHGVWYEDIYTAIPYTDGMILQVTLDFRHAVELNGLYYSLIDRAKNKIEKVEVYDEATSAWWTAGSGSTGYDSEKGWTSLVGDPIDLIITNYRSGLNTLPGTTKVKQLRITIRNFDYDYVVIDEISRLTFVPKTKSDVLKYQTQVTATKLARYKVGIYYLAPYLRTFADAGTYHSHDQHTGFVPSFIYANHLALFSKGLQVPPLTDAQLAYRLVIGRDGEEIPCQMQLGLPGILCYQYKDGVRQGIVVPTDKKEIINLATVGDEKIMGTTITPAVSPYIDYDYWFDMDAKKWKYIDPNNATIFTNSATRVVQLLAIPETTTEQVYQVAFGEEVPPGSPDTLVDSLYGKLS